MFISRRIHLRQNVPFLLVALTEGATTHSEVATRSSCSFLTYSLDQEKERKDQDDVEPSGMILHQQSSRIGNLEKVFRSRRAFFLSFLNFGHIGLWDPSSLTRD